MHLHTYLAKQYLSRGRKNPTFMVAVALALGEEVGSPATWSCCQKGGA